LYRIYTALIARSIRATNKSHGPKIFTAEQKGFIEGCNGCCKDSIFPNELFAHTRCTKKAIITCQTDFTNAFASVPQGLIYANIRQLGLPEDLVNTVEDFYTGASSVITLSSENTGAISWKIGTKQGCQLIPVQFNLCPELLLRELTTKKEELGLEIDFGALVHANDLILTTGTEEKLTAMLKIPEEFYKYSHMTVNAKKCWIISSLIGAKDGGRRAIETKSSFAREGLLKLEHEHATLYIRSPVGGTRKEMANPSQARFDTMRDDIVKICESDLVVARKLEALKMSSVPMVGFLLWAPVAGSLKEFYQYIHRTVTEWIGGNLLPEPFFHMILRDGGFGLASLRERRNSLLIREVSQMLETPKGELAAIMHRFAEAERVNRGYANHDNAGFLNWGVVERKPMPPPNTTTIFARALDAANPPGIKQHVTPKEVIIEQPDGKPYDDGREGTLTNTGDIAARPMVQAR
jgi:hypothetical protein